MDHFSKELVSSVDPEKLKNMTLDLVRIPSPTGHSDDVSEFYAEYLKKIGLQPEIEQVIPGAPNVLATVKGYDPGPKLTLLAHLDTIPSLGHPDPYYDNGIIYGRGSADMKSGVAAQTEVARILIENDVKFNGELMIATHSAHEIPGGACEGLFKMIKSGILGDAVISTEGRNDVLPIEAKGMCQYDIHITRPGEIIHEQAARNIPHPIMIARKLLEVMEQRNALWEKHSFEFIGSQTLFVGKIESGNFYNRLPKDCLIVGTIRFGPDKSFDDIEQEFNSLISEVQATTTAEINLKLNCIGLGYQLKKETPIVQDLCKAYVEVTGYPLPYGGITFAADAAKVNRFSHISAVQYGTGVEFAHAELERVNVADIVKVTKVLLLATLNFLGCSN
jgi:succinyl-diaminopimelate desuccinylase